MSQKLTLASFGLLWTTPLIGGESNNLKKLNKNKVSWRKRIGVARPFLYLVK